MYTEKFDKNTVSVECSNLNLLHAFILDCESQGIQLDEQWNETRIKKYRDGVLPPYYAVFNKTEPYQTIQLFSYDVQQLEFKFKLPEQYNVAIETIKKCNANILADKIAKEAETKIEEESKDECAASNTTIGCQAHLGEIVTDSSVSSTSDISGRRYCRANYYFGIYRRDTAMLCKGAGTAVHLINMATQNNPKDYTYEDLKTALKKLNHWEWRRFTSLKDAYAWLAYETNK